MADRPRIIPWNVPAGGGGTGGGAAPKPETGQGPKGGDGNSTNNSGGCEEYNCNCDAINGQIDEYNTAVDELSSIILGGNKLKDKTKESLERFIEGLKAVEYDPADDPSDKIPCEICTCNDLRNALLGTIGPQGRVVILDCCGPNGSKICFGPGGGTPFTNPPNNGDPDPCGNDADNRRKISLLPTDCDINLQIGETIKVIPKIYCEEKLPEKGCTNKIVELQLLSSESINIPLPLLEDTIKIIQKLFDYINNINEKIEDLQDYGGIKNSLAQEACLVALLNVLCSNVNGMSDQVKSADCAKAMHNTAQFPLSRNAQSACDQLMHEIAYNHTGTFGHMGNVTRGLRGPDNDWRNKGLNLNTVDPGENDKNPNCAPGNRIRTTDSVFVPINGNPKATVQAKLAQMQENYTGCQNSGLKIEETKDPVPCGGNIPCDCASVDPQTLSPDDVQMLDYLKTEKTNAERALASIINRQLFLANQLKTLEGDIDKARGPQLPILIAQREQIIAEQNDLISNQNALDSRLNELNQEIDILLRKQGELVGSCVEFTYSYCPAKSTPKIGKGRAPGAGGGVTRDKETDHSNFYDLLRSVRDVMLQDIFNSEDCPPHNPLGDAIQDCFGTPPGKDPLAGSGNDPADNAIGDGTHCKDNNNVKMIPSSGPCNQLETDMEREKCILKLYRLVTGLKNAMKKADAPKATNLVVRLSTFSKNIDALIKAFAELDMPDGVQCKGWNAEKTIRDIKKLTDIVNGLVRDAERLYQ
jgi:uncharacterized coiled-coil protein SlyX